MAGRQSRRKRADTFVAHPWLWPAVTVVVLFAIAILLLTAARQVYESGRSGGFPKVVASGALSAAGVAVFGAAITGLLALANEFRAGLERRMSKRLDLFRRMRTAHVRVALAQQVLRTQRDVAVYHVQMQDLMKVTKDLEEIREEVRVSGDLYARDDRSSIVEGIARIIVFLQEGIAEYTGWCRGGTDSRRRWRPARPHGEWLVQLVEERDSPESGLAPSDETWAPRGNMPVAYDDGLEMSKLVMRAYVYGSSRTEGAIRATAAS